jgi:hypothetical protein
MYLFISFLPRLKMSDEAESGSLTWSIITFAAFSIVTTIVFFTAVNYTDPAHAGVFVPGNNCQILTCPAGPIGPTGGTGATGIGQKGASGASGPQGPQGPSGPQGEPGVAMCLANPGCGVGPSGATGSKGSKGDRGVSGFDGKQGAQGVIGPMGFNGTVGPSGASGPSGPSGPIGPNGICDCFNISTIAFPEVNISNSFNLESGAIMTCSNGAHIDASSCFAQGAACPDYSQCFIPINQLHVKDYGFVKPFLQVGGTSFPFNTSGAGVFFGECNYYVLDIIKMCASIVEIGVINGPLHLFSLNQDTTIETMGGFATLRLTGSGGTILSSTSTVSPLQINSNGGMIISNFGFNGINVSSTIGNIEVMVPNAGLNAVCGTFSFLKTDGNTPWFESYPSINYQDQSSESRMAVLFGPSILLSGTDTAITTIDPSGTVRIGPNIDVGAGRIFTLQQIFRIGRGVFFNQSISLEEPIRNDALSGNPSAYQNLAAGHVWIDDDVRISGNVTIDGNLNVAGMTTNNPSDARVKRNIRSIETEESIRRIKRLRPTQYEFNDEYQSIDSSVGDGTHLGFIAQEVEQIIPSAIRRKRNALYPDFMHLQKDEIIADLVKTVQYLLERIK